MPSSSCCEVGSKVAARSCGGPCIAPGLLLHLADYNCFDFTLALHHQTVGFGGPKWRLDVTHAETHVEQRQHPLLPPLSRRLRLPRKKGSGIRSSPRNRCKAA